MEGKYVFLWSSPRCVSTAFERPIRTLENVLDIHGPFTMPFYFGPGKRLGSCNDLPVIPDATYQSAFITLRHAIKENRFVFVKDMAKNIADKVDMFLQDGLKQFQHTFLIRHPIKAVRSLLNIAPYFAAHNMVRYKELYEVYKFVKDNINPSPVVIDADDLLQFPDEVMRAYCEAVGFGYEEGMTRWQPGPIPEWTMPFCKGWHDDVFNSSGFVKKSEEKSKIPDLNEFPQEALDVIEMSMPYYETLYANRIIPKEMQQQ